MKTTSVLVKFDSELLQKIDKDAESNIRTRKAQVEYIIKQYYSKELKR